MNRRKDTFSSVSFSQYSVDFGLKGAQKGRKDSVRTHSFGELITALSNETLSQDDRYKWFVEANRRFTTPLLSLVYALIACTGLLISNFNRRGQTKIVGIAVLSIILIQATDLIAGNLACKNLCWLILLYFNIAIPSVICLLLLTKPEILQNLKNYKIGLSGEYHA